MNGSTRENQNKDHKVTRVNREALDLRFDNDFIPFYNLF